MEEKLFFWENFFALLCNPHGWIRTTNLPTPGCSTTWTTWGIVLLTCYSVSFGRCSNDDPPPYRWTFDLTLGFNWTGRSRTCKYHGSIYLSLMGTALCAVPYISTNIPKIFVLLHDQMKRIYVLARYSSILQPPTTAVSLWQCIDSLLWYRALLFSLRRSAYSQISQERPDTATLMGIEPITSDRQSDMITFSPQSQKAGTAGFEPATDRLTADCSTIGLCSRARIGLP